MLHPFLFHCFFLPFTLLISNIDFAICFFSFRPIVFLHIVYLLPLDLCVFAFYLLDVYIHLFAVSL